MRTIRKRTRQISPSNDLDGRGDPIAPRYTVRYEEQEPGGFWHPISVVEAERLIAEGKAVLV